MFQYFKKYPDLLVSFSRSSDGSMKLTNNPNLAEKISQNRNAYFLKNNINPEKVVSAGIVHGNKIAVAHKKDGRKIISGADGLLTQEKNLFLSITSADCLPIFLFDPKKKVVGIVHAGWRSLFENIISSATKKIRDNFQSNPQDILVGIGPAICQNHYEVGPEVAEKFKKYPEAIRKENEKIYLDLKKIAELQFAEAGIQKKNQPKTDRPRADIEISPECTFELPEKYFSARRDSPAEIEAMIAIIGLKV